MSCYDGDLVLWSHHQADLLRRMSAGERVNEQVDWDNLAEEIESLGNSERRELRNRIQTVLRHLIKLQASPATQPRMGWKRTVVEQRIQIERLLEDSPSLRQVAATAISDELPAARTLASLDLTEFEEPLLVRPEEQTFTQDAVLGSWLPE